MLRKLLGAATVALVLSGSALASVAKSNCPCAISSGNVTACIEAVSYQALPASGVNVKNDAFYFQQPITLPKNATITIELKNATFVNPSSIVLVVDDGNQTEKVAPDTTSASKLTFTMTKDARLVELTEVDGSGNSTNKLELNLPGTLKPGDRVELVLTSVDQDGNHIQGGCVRQDIMIVDNQYVAFNKRGADEEPLAVTLKGLTKLFRVTFIRLPRDVSTNTSSIKTLTALQLWRNPNSYSTTRTISKNGDMFWYTAIEKPNAKNLTQAKAHALVKGSILFSFLYLCLRL